MTSTAGRMTAAALRAAAVVVGCTGPGPTPGPTESGPTSGPTSPAYDERWRPQFHYSPATGRMADPNGLVRLDDEWHLFHQQDGTWAHAVSPDLVHWEPLPTALEHDTLGQALSGSAVVDGANTSGLLGDAQGQGLVAVYTSTEGGEAQSIATSSDRGRTFTRYDGNPVIPNDGRTDFRDPKVFWHEDTGRWVMVVAAGDHVEMWGSADLRAWEHLSDFGAGQGLHSAVWECPDLFPLPVEGADGDGEVRWVLTVSVGDSAETDGSTAQYFVGDFDGTTFTRDAATPAETVQVTDVGQDFYAAQTFENADGRRIWMGWMGSWRFPYSAPTSPWQNAMSVPRELSLRRDGEGYLLAQSPVDELTGLRAEPVVEEQDVDVSPEVRLPDPGEAYEVVAEVELGDADQVGLRLHEKRDDDEVAEAAVVGLSRDEVFLDRTDAGVTELPDAAGDPAPFGVRRSTPYESDDGVVRLHVLVDTSSVEAFVDDGARTGTMVVYPSEGADGLSVYADGGTARLRSLTVWPLDSIWPPAGPTSEETP